MRLEQAGFVSIGLLDQSEWKGEWIGLDDGPKPPLTQDVRDEMVRDAVDQARVPARAGAACRHVPLGV